MSQGDSETSRYRHLTKKYCYRADGEPGCVVDLASQGDPVVPWAIQFDLPPKEFAYYNSNHPARGPIQLRGDARQLPFDDYSVDTLYSSHLLEDFEVWTPVLAEWRRVVKPGGHLIILVPDRELFQAALAKGQCPNDFHRHESKPGELTEHLGGVMDVIEDRLTNQFDGDYTVLFVARQR